MRIYTKNDAGRAPITTETLRQTVENDLFVLFYGMPSIMLEKTIQFLHEALIKQVPENKTRL